jgi:hypothetical protein
MSNDKQSNTATEALDTAAWNARKIHSLAWAAENLLLLNSDQTISDLELRSRVGCILDVVISRADDLANFLDGGYRHVNDKTKT